MRIILWAAIAANGTYMHGGSEYRWPGVIFKDFDDSAKQAGNCVIGRKTYDEYVGSGGDLGEIETVVVSRTVKDAPRVTCVGSPKDAVAYLEAKGHESLLVGGGDSILNSFLQEGLADEIVLNVTPEIASAGNQLALAGKGVHRPMKLIEFQGIGAGILRLRYELSR